VTRYICQPVTEPLSKPPLTSNVPDTTLNAVFTIVKPMSMRIKLARILSVLALMKTPFLPRNNSFTGLLETATKR